MADSTPASAPSSSRSSSRSIRDPAADEPFAPRRRSAASLAVEAQGQLDRLCDTRLAYACIEQLLDPDCLSDSGKIHATRSQLSALFRLLNKELKQHLESADAALQSVRDALDSDA